MTKSIKIAIAANLVSLAMLLFPFTADARQAAPQDAQIEALEAGLDRALGVETAQAVATEIVLDEMIVVAASRPKATKAAKKTLRTETVSAKVWTCGPREELWQGSGSARICEWK